MLRSSFKIVLGVFLSLQLISINSIAQTIYINGKIGDLKKCIPLDSIKNISIEGSDTTITFIEIYLARGAHSLGSKKFSSPKQLSDFDVKAWLVSEKKENNTALKSSSESDPKSKAVPGDRIMVVVNGEGVKPIASFYLATCR